MAYYWGKFRSIDTSVDPLGQEYKVVIFTDYDQLASPYKFDPVTEEPDLGTELTMAAQPFTVQYMNEDNNIYKPHKCSTSTVKFMMGNFNPDFFTNKDNNIMVALLKRDNNIQQRGNVYVDIRTNTTVIRKRAYGLFYGFLPSEVDTYCYTVEWIGYAMPQSYSQPFTRVTEEFELQCQDAYSTLSTRIFPYSDEIEIYDPKRIIVKIVGQLGCYRHIYFSDAIKLPYAHDIGNLPRMTALGIALIQYRDFIDEDGTPVKEMSVLDAICEFFGLTAIPWGDSLWLVNYEGIKGGVNNYSHYIFEQNNNLFFNYRTDNPNDIANLQHNRTDVCQLTADSFASDDTSLTLQNVYSNFKVKCDEEEYQLMPDLGEEKNYSRMAVNNPQFNYMYTETLTPSDPSQHNWYESAKWDGGVICELQQVDGIGFKSYIYRASYLDGDDAPVDNYDIQRTELIPSIFNVNFYDDYDPNYYCGCALLKNTKIKGSESEEYTWFYSKDRSTLYNQAWPNTIVMWGKQNFGHTVSRPDYNNWWTYNNQVQLEYTSQSMVIRQGKAISIKGDWTFFRNNAFISLPLQDNTRAGWGTDGLDVHVDKTKMYIRARITITFRNYATGVDDVYYVATGEDDTLYMTVMPSIAKLALDDTNYDSKKPFGQKFNFKNSDGHDSGLTLSLGPIISEQTTGTERVARIKVEIMKVFGVAQDSQNYMVPCNSAALENFEISLIDEEQIQSWGYGQITTDFHNSLDKFAENYEVDNKLSTNQYVNKMAYNYAFRALGGRLLQLDCLNNVATGIVGRPEILKLADIYNQYSTMTVGVSTTLWHGIVSPWSLVQWHGREYIWDSASIDFEMNRDTVIMIEKKLSGQVPNIDQKMYLENENGRTLNYNPFYNETFRPTLPSRYESDAGYVRGRMNVSGGTDVNTVPSLWVNFGDDGIVLMAGVPDAVDDDIDIFINNNNNELTITN